ncbi:MAG: sensor domain-containing diguanylate cyclase [Planctomycetes bacterium]|nr:sensor domain-containing diguanylate cyclase [Planctomycetota bacterium]
MVLKRLSLKTLVGSGSPPDALTVGILCAHKPLASSLQSVCQEEGIECRRFKNASRLLKAAGNGRLAAIVWDTRAAEPDWDALSELDGEVAVLMLGDICPPAGLTLSSPFFIFPAEGSLDDIQQAVRTLVDWRRADGRLNRAEEELEETRQRLDKATNLSESLKEHLDFYEMQRNRLSETVNRTAYLGQISKELNCLDTDKIVEICVTKAPKIVDATLASIYFYDESDRTLYLKKANHPYPLVDRASLDETPKTLMAMAVENKATLLIRDMTIFQQGIRQTIDRTYAGRYQTASCIVVPLMSGDQVLAVLNLADKADAKPFSEVRDLPLVDHISQFIGIALRNCQLYREVQMQARTDGLTGFINHNAFFTDLNREIERSRRGRLDLSLILLDVDNFKLFNDVHGHQVGDSILQDVARAIHASVRTVDIPARYGGDEFAVILSDTDIERGQLVAERIRRAVASKTMTLDGKAFSITVSAGVTQYVPGQDPSDLVTAVDAALYQAKSHGRNAVVAGTG